MSDAHSPVPDEGAFLASEAVITIGQPNGLTAESIRALRTQLVTARDADAPTGLAVCGPAAGVGATFVAVNLAVSLAQIGMKTLLVDADMRNPGVDQMLIPPAPVSGLAQALTGQGEAYDLVQQHVLPDLSVLYAGGVVPNPQELLSTQAFRQLVELWSREYDFTIVDTPPANQSADGRYVSAVLGSAVVVARKDHTSISDLKTLVAELDQGGATVAGTVLNEH